MDKIREAIQALLGLKELPDGKDLAGFSDEDLAAAVEKAKQSFAEAKESKDLGAATTARDIVKAVEAENVRRAEAAADVEAKFAELESDLEASDQEDADEEEVEEVEEEEDKEEDGDDAAEAEAEVEVEAEEEEKEEVKAEVKEEPAEDKPAKVAASAKKKALPKPSAARPATAKTRIIASGDIDGFSAGQGMNIDQLAQAWVGKADAVFNARTVGQRVGVATIKADYPSGRVLDPSNPADVNSNIINKIVEEAREATKANLRKMLSTRDEAELSVLQAEGGLCAPLEPRYDIFQIGDDGRPLAASLPGFNAKRGGIRYIDADTVPYMGDTDAALGHFTEDQDTSGVNYPKPCLRIDCPTWTEVFVEADTLCMEVGMWTQLTFPELFKAWWSRAFIQKARTSETRLWDNMVSLSTAVTEGQGLGATSDTLTALDRLAVQLRWRYRVAETQPVRLWAPSFLKAILRTDLARRATGDGLDVLAVSDGQLARYFAARNIAVTYVSDAQSPGGANGDVQAAGGINPFPSTVEVIMALEGTFIFLEMGGLNFGTEIRDFDMIRNNDVGAFLETFENVARVGPQAFAITLDLCPDGTTSGPNSSYDPCTTGS